MTEPAAIYFADLVHPNNQNKTFPYAAGCVAAYSAATFGDQVTIDIFRSPEDLAAAFAERIPQVLALTNYVWNLELTAEVMRQAKATAPNLVVVMGGPNYSTEPEGQAQFLESHPEVDFYIYKEGEIAFAKLLELLLAANFDAAEVRSWRRELDAVHYRGPDGPLLPAPSARQKDLDELPSPYLSGQLDKFFVGHALAPLLQTKRGCPFQCTFCVEGESYYSKLGAASSGRVKAELEYIASRMAGGPPILFIADSNFGMYEHDLEVCDLIADIRRRYGWPQTIDVSTGKNRKERVIEAVRRTQGAMRFGPALQTTDRQTLINIKRSNISETVLMDMASAAGELDQRTYTELILGLPGETPASHLRSIQAAMEAGIQRIKMYPLLLLPGTEMSTVESRQQFGLQTGFRVLPQSHGTYRFLGDRFASAEISEIVVATNTMSFDEYLECKRFDLSVEIFYNDHYLEEVHGLLRSLHLPAFDFVRHCHQQILAAPNAIQSLYLEVERGVRDNLWSSRDECAAHFRDPAHLAEYVAREYQTSIAFLKAIALTEHIDAVLAAVRNALSALARELGAEEAMPGDYLDELIEFSRLRRRDLFDSDVQPEGVFRYDFDQIGQRRFDIDPNQYRLTAPRRMRFWHDAEQAQAITTLCRRHPDRLLRARSFIYPPSDPSSNPYLRRADFC